MVALQRVRAFARRCSTAVVGHQETVGQSDSSRSAGRWNPRPTSDVLLCGRSV